MNGVLTTWEQEGPVTTGARVVRSLNGARPVDRHPSPVPRPRRRSRSLWAVVAVVALVVSACSAGSNSDGEDAEEEKPSLVGEYQLIGDVGGTQVDDDATVTLSLKPDGTLTLLAVQPDETLEDTGTWSVTGTDIQVATADETLVGDGPFEVRGDILILPFFVFGEGEGTSEWKRTTAPVTVDDDDDDQEKADGPSGNLEDMWELEGPDAVASAVGMKAYSEAIAEGTAQADAVLVALDEVQAMDSVESAEVSDNGLNIEIVYEDGTTDEILTERLLAVGDDDPSAGAAEPEVSNLTGAGLSSQGLGALGAGAFSSATGSTAAAPDIATCAKVPANGGTPQEPTREGINPGGGYGVSAYLPTVDPKPIRSEDSPPADQRSAVLVSPQYDVTHGGPADADTIRGQAGSNIECIEASLSSSGYDVTTILGKDGDPDSTGLKATAAFIDSLSDQPGVVYFLGHGASGKNKNYLDMGPLDMTLEPVTKITGGKSVKIDKAMAERINESLTKYLGLEWDPNNMVLNISPDSQSVVTLWLHPEFFRAVRARGASFENSLVWLNACSSAATGTFQAAIQAKAFVGWENDMTGAYIADASEAAFDSLTDSTRTARGAVQVWQLHALWEIGSGTAAANLEPRNLWAGGKTTEYLPLTGQAHVLLFYIRHAPGTAVSDLAANARGVRACYDQYWAGGNRAGIGTTCLKLQMGVPTEADVLEAMFEAGAPGSGAPGAAAGRWTLAD